MYSHKNHFHTFEIRFLAMAGFLPLLFLLPFSLMAQDQNGKELQNLSSDIVVNENRSYRINAHRVESGMIRIDGLLDEAVWDHASAISGFTQTSPNPGEAASEKTIAWVLYSDDAIYIGARMYDSAPDSIASTLFRKDGDGYSDWIGVGIDSYNDSRTAFVFSVSPRGVRKDMMIFNDDQFDQSWDAVWEAAASIDEEGWTAEMRIPLSQLRYNGEEPTGERSWGINFLREIARKGEASFWSPIPPEASGLVSRSGRLDNIMNLPESRRLEFLPYTSGQLDRAPGNSADPFYKQNALGSNIGADVKYGIGSNMTLTATINPDFGQVEVDPAVVNLTAFETFFQERRPFFLEGSEIFSFGFSGNIQMGGEPRLLHTRRVGRAPQGRAPGSALFTDTPSQTPIAGAVKLSGKTSGGWSVGLLNALTLKQDAQFTSDGETIESIPVEPLSNYTVGRVQRDFRGGQTVTGIMFNSMYRDINTNALQDRLTDQAYSGGVDFEQSWSNRKYRLNGFITGSYISGEPVVIESIQRSSARYYQRPDAGHLNLDSDRNYLSGTYTDVMFTSETRKWLTQFRAYQISPGFEVNDMGFQSAADRRLLSGMATRQQQSPVGIFRNYNLWVAAVGAWNTAGDLLENLSGTGAFFNFKNFWTLNYNILGGFRSSDDRLTRGGPLAGTPAHVSFNMNVNSDHRKNVSVSPGFMHRRTELDEYLTNIWLSVRYRPHQAATITIRPNLSRNYNATQYISTVADPQMTETFGNRYVFADLKQTTVSASIRVDWTFTPDLSLQLFAQPFVSAGKFGRFKELSRPESIHYNVYGEDVGSVDYQEDNDSYQIDPDGTGTGSGEFSVNNPDFNIRSLRGNAVVRWEFRPGSTLFLVWQQTRSSREQTGVFDAGNDFGELFRSQASHTFLVKFSYWFGM
ncbi:MAG: DUF5916 domain-containing protein [Balneolaceae bacterium]